MLRTQKPYDFKKELLQIHKPDVRDYSKKPAEDEFVFTDGIRIVVPKTDDKKIISTAAKDFIDYLLVSMHVPAVMAYDCPGGGTAVYLSVCKDVDAGAQGYMGHSINICKDGISITGYDEVGVAQALYFLEDLMNLRKAPFLKYETHNRKSLFDYRQTQSPFGIHEYPEEAFALIAHRGYNTLAIWLKDGCTSLSGDYIDLNLLGQRAEKWGLQLVAELYAPHNVHPDDAGAQEFYDKLYGDLFENCPMLAGVYLVGEANQFQSRDPKVGKTPYDKNFVDNIPTGKMAPGWWPCEDYPRFAAMVQNAVKKANPNAFVIVCSYNWGYAPEKERIELLNALPDGVRFMSTWDMFHRYMRDGASFYIADYTLQFDGPGDYFTSEAIAAQKRGMHMTTIANTAGLTWDFGVIPYEPMSTRWIKRYEGLQKAHKEWNVSGVVEDIHYGFYPSIIGDLEKRAFFAPCKPLNEVLADLLVRDFGEDADRAGKAMEIFSDAITYYPTTEDDQYGAFRIGPAYPFWVRTPPTEGKMPNRRHAMFGNAIYSSEYAANNIPSSRESSESMPGKRIYVEIESTQKMLDLLGEGIKILESAPNPNDNLLRLLNLARFMYNSTVSGIHIKQLHILRSKLSIAQTAEENEKLICEIEDLLLRERKNAEDTIPLVRLDSRLGWEPSMEYKTDEAGLLWKLRQIDYDLEFTIPTYKKANRLSRGESNPSGF